MQRSIQTQINLEKMNFFDRRIHYSKLNIKQKPLRKNNRASKSIRKYFIQKLGWDQSFANEKIPQIVQPLIINSKRLYRKKSQPSHNLNTRDTLEKYQNELKFRIHKLSSPRNNLYSFRSFSSHCKNNNKIKPQNSFKDIIKYLEQNIQKIYQVKQISQSHISIMKNIRLSLSGVESQEIKILKLQLKDLKSPISRIHAVKLACLARQNTILAIKKIIQSLLSQQDSNQSNNLHNLLRQLRNHSLNCIEKILRWKQLLQQFQITINKKIPIKFKYQSAYDNYMMKILYDTQFIYQSGLFKNATYPDPFLLSYEQQIMMEMKKYSKIRACQLFLLEQSL